MPFAIIVKGGRRGGDEERHRGGTSHMADILWRNRYLIPYCLRVYTFHSTRHVWGDTRAARKKETREREREAATSHTRAISINRSEMETPHCIKQSDESTKKLISSRIKVSYRYIGRFNKIKKCERLKMEFTDYYAREILLEFPIDYKRETD